MNTVKDAIHDEKFLSTLADDFAAEYGFAAGTAKVFTRLMCCMFLIKENPAAAEQIAIDATRELIKLNGELQSVTTERDDARDQLQKIGRKAFWAAGQK